MYACSLLNYLTHRSFLIVDTDKSLDIPYASCGSGARRNLPDDGLQTPLAGRAYRVSPRNKHGVLCVQAVLPAP